MLRLRGADPPRYTYCQIEEVQLGRKAITVNGNYVVTNLAPSDPAIIGEYWAQDGITIIELAQGGA